jgi:hypothetical protein
MSRSKSVTGLPKSGETGSDLSRSWFREGDARRLRDIDGIQLILENRSGLLSNVQAGRLGCILALYPTVPTRSRK